jgi:hypothetical protein
LLEYAGYYNSIGMILKKRGFEMKKRMILAVITMVIFAMFSACSKTPAARNISFDSQSVQQIKSVQNIDLSRAENIIKNTINLDYSKYKISLVNSNIDYKGQRYFQFIISDGKTSIGPSVIVSKDDGEIYCYYSDKSVTEVYQDKVFKTNA